MKFTEYRQTFAHFLVQVCVPRSLVLQRVGSNDEFCDMYQICAIVGGVFTVMGLVNSALHSSLKHILKKAEMGKLG